MSAKTWQAFDDALFRALHERIGYCGHCGKRDCGARESYSRLPDSIPTSVLIAVAEVARAQMRKRKLNATSDR